LKIKHIVLIQIVMMGTLLIVALAKYGSAFNFEVVLSLGAVGFLLAYYDMLHIDDIKEELEDRIDYLEGCLDRLEDGLIENTDKEEEDHYYGPG